MQDTSPEEEAKREEIWHELMEEVPKFSQEANLSINALEGSQGSETIRVLGQFENR